MRSHLWIQTLSRLLIITSVEPSQNRTRTAKSPDLVIKILTPFNVYGCHLHTFGLQPATPLSAYHRHFFGLPPALPLPGCQGQAFTIPIAIPLPGYHRHAFGLSTAMPSAIWLALQYVWPPIRLLQGLVFTPSQQVEVQFISTRLKKLPISSNNRELEAPEPTILHKSSK